MTVKTEKMKVAEVYILLMWIVLCMALCYPVFGDLIFLFLVLLAWGVLYLISVGKTLIFHADGLTVRFWFYQKSYSWSELKLKRCIYFADGYGYDELSSSGAEFSPRAFKRPKRLKPLTYAAFCHPFHYYFVHFKPDEVPRGRRTSYRAVYTVDEFEFRAKLEEWGVRLDDK